MEFTYDKNGNLLTKGSELINTWNYDNHLISDIAGDITNTYTYDTSGQRLTSSDGGATTIYANKYYNINDGNATKHIFANNLEVAVITGTNSEAVIHYTATDHLTSSSLTTNPSNAKEELLDYLPFGTIRIDQKTGDSSDQRKFAGYEYDNDTGLSYANARYYDGGTGRFISQDPAFLAVGDNEKIKSITDKELTVYLSDPQGFNSYAYARNNPLRNIDASGEYYESVLDLVSLAISTYVYNRNHNLWNGVSVGLDAIGLTTPLPAIFGYAKNSNRTIGISNYFSKLANNASGAARLGKLFVQNAGFKFTRRAWSTGEAGNDVASLVGHYYKHGAEVGARDAGDYYHKANNFINNKQYTNIFKEGADTVYYNNKNNYSAIVGRDGAISTYYKVTNPNKINSYLQRIKK